MAGKNSGNDIRCSFCNKTQSQVRKLIAGPAGVYICDECVDICADILEEELEDEEVEETATPDTRFPCYKSNLLLRWPFLLLPLYP